MIPSAFVRLSTGIKMLIVLSAALLPLGVIALFASLDSAHSRQISRQTEARMMAAESARQLSSAIGDAQLAMRRALVAFGPVPPNAAICQRTLNALLVEQRYEVRYALYDLRGYRLCATRHFHAFAPGASHAAADGTPRIARNGAAVRFMLPGAGIVGVGEVPRAVIAAAARPRFAAGTYGMVLRQGDQAMPLETITQSSPLSRVMTVLAPVLGGQLTLEMMVSITPIGPLEMLLMLLPLLMWVAAAMIGWLVVDRLLLRPLGQMQRAITDYGVGAGPLLIPAMTTPAQELRALGGAFRSVTEQLSRHEADLERSLARQTRLTREVHHRVKNNLQVVSSLINLHSRGARSEEAAGAYAAIQRRVDALAVVHRNHYAELEENRGVGLRPLIGELASNLRATAPDGVANMPIVLDLMPAFASQDVAVSVAFLVTELIEMVMECDPRSGVTISLRPADAPDRAELSLLAPGLSSDLCACHPSILRFHRVVDGLARQLRAPLIRDETAGFYAIGIAIIPPLGDEAA